MNDIQEIIKNLNKKKIIIILLCFIIGITSLKLIQRLFGIIETYKEYSIPFNIIGFILGFSEKYSRKAKEYGL